MPGNPREQLTQLLTELANHIKQLPASLPEEDEFGPIAIHLSDHSIDEEEGPFYSFNRSWEQVFQQAKPEKLVVRGKYGLELAHSFCVFYAQTSKIADNGGLDLMIMHVQTLIALIEKV